MVARPTTDPTTTPAIVPGEILAVLAAAVEELPEDDEFNPIIEDLTLASDDDGAAQPSLGALGANPSMGCAYACAPEVVATKGAMFVEPFSSYLRAVTVDDTTKSL